MRVKGAGRFAKVGILRANDRKKIEKSLSVHDDYVNECAPALSRPTVVVDTSDAYSFMTAAKALEKGGIPFRTEKEYTADLVEGRSFLGPYMWRIIVEEEQRKEACRLIEEGGGYVVIDVPDEEDSTTVEPASCERRFWIIFIYVIPALVAVLWMLVKWLMD